METSKKTAQVCIRCARCIHACPMGLNPVNIMTTMKTMPVDKAKIKLLNPSVCDECRKCNDICPSNIDLATIVKRAKIVAKLP